MSAATLLGPNLVLPKLVPRKAIELPTWTPSSKMTAAALNCLPTPNSGQHREALPLHLRARGETLLRHAQHPRNEARHRLRQSEDRPTEPNAEVGKGFKDQMRFQSP